MSNKTATADLTLNETLAARGLATRPAGSRWSLGSKDILDATGAVVFTGDSVEVWAWLKTIRA